MIQRRTFLSLATTGLAARFAQADALPLQTALVWGMFPKEMGIGQRFDLAKQVGFDGIECYTEEDPQRAEEILKASQRTGVKVHSVMNQKHWQYPLSSPDSAAVKTSMEGMRTSLRNAKLWGADTVLLVPAVVNDQVSYGEAWKRSQRQIQELLPLAQDLKVVIAVEEVWNKFLLSPLEFAHYVDEFKSPWVKAYFDVGNVMLYGYPQDWIRALGPRIVKLHFKDFRSKREGGVLMGEFVQLREGDVDWKEIHKALSEIGYKGAATLELKSGDADYLKECMRRFRLILEGA